MTDLFQKIEEKRDDYNIEIYVTFLEIYNEEIRDLLAEPGTPTPRGGLQIREDKCVKVVGLVELHPTSADQIRDIVLLGNTRRTQSPTHANETSSRSHAVLQVHVSQSPRTASTTEQRTMATLSIIDLAGSERAAATTNMGQRMVEGANINKSLLALGNCINALCESAGATRHVPYRNSKLTRLLKFSLGGNCKTVMIVCVAPTSNHFDDTHNTLLYADRASKIKTKVVTRNVVNVDRHVGQYVEAINRLNAEVAELKAKLAGKVGNDAELIRRKKEQAKAEVDRAREDIQRKADQTRPSIISGASCEGRTITAQLKSKAYNVRLTQLKEQILSGAGTPDLLAERAMLESLIASEDAEIHPSSNLQAQLMRSQNANSMFDATLRAVTERRSDRLDDISMENIRLDAQAQKAEMERQKLEAQRDALQTALLSQSELIAGFVGALTRCTVMLEDGSKTLQQASQEGAEVLNEKSLAMSSTFHHLAEAINTTFSSYLGKTVNHTLGEGSSVVPSNAYPSDFISITSNVRANETSLLPSTSSRRASVANLGVPASPGKRRLRSPRKSLRSSLAHNTLHGRRGVSSRPAEKKKGVQWKDEAGQGSLDDSGGRDSPMAVDSRMGSPRPSESDWEDEKTDDSTSYNIGSTSNEGISARERPRRPSRLEPLLLKSRSYSSSLGKMTEADELRKVESTGSRNPFTSRIVNLPPVSTTSESSLAPQKLKKEEREQSPARKAASSLRLPGSATKGRRRSNIGPLRSEKTTRRRSSLLHPPPLITTTQEGEDTSTTSSAKTGPRRVPIVHTPAKRPKRSSILGGLGGRSTTSIRTSLSSRSTLGTTNDPNGSADMSFKGTKPTWR